MCLNGGTSKANIHATSVHGLALTRTMKNNRRKDIRIGGKYDKETKARRNTIYFQ